MDISHLTPNAVVTGPVFPEPVQVIVVEPLGDSVRVIGRGMHTNTVHSPVLNASQIAALTVTPEREPFDGNSERFRLGIEENRDV